MFNYQISPHVSINKLLHAIFFIMLFAICNSYGAVFEDDEARRAILDLRQRVENLRQAQVSSEAALLRAINSVNTNQQTLEDAITGSKDDLKRIMSIQFEQNKILNDVIAKQKLNEIEFAKLIQSILQIQLQIDNLKK